MKRRGCCSPRTKRTPSDSSTRPTRPLRQGRVPCVRRGRQDRRRQPGAGRHQGRRSLPPRGRRRPVGGGTTLPHRCAAGTSVRRLREDGRGQAQRGGRVLPILHAGVRQRGRRARHATGLRRPVLDQAVFFFDVNMWLREHGVHPLDSPASVSIRNRHWFHMFNDDVISMPDKWEYPWYAAWDLAFHAVALADVDPGLCEASARPDVEAAISALQRSAARL